MAASAFGFQALDRLVGNLSDTYGTGKGLRNEKRGEEMGDYLARERLGIQARVEGAKAAGLHPLVGVGFQSGPGPTSVIGGGGLGGSYAPYDSPPPQPEAKTDADIAKFNAARARREEAMANQAELQYETDLVNSRKATATQPGNPPLYPTDPDNLPPGQGSRISGIRIKPNEIVSSINGTEVGTQPTLAVGRGSDGRKWHGLSDWGLKQTEDMEMTRLGLLAYLNRMNILDSVGFNDARMKYRTWDQSRSQSKATRYEDNRELRRLINQSRARHGY
ncbi:DNA pilot protein [robinz microvirus RP_175]|nr:DNA pilot protein [robinz microvirus RP_175]